MLDKDQEEIIAFYNVENLFTPDLPPVHKYDPTKSGLNNWDERKYQLKLSKIAQVFQLIAEDEGVLPMLIGLSEIQGEKPLQDLIKLSPFNDQYGIVHYESMDERGVDVALLYDRSKIDVISSDPISYFFAVETERAEYFDTTRDVLFCKLKYQETILNTFVLHLPSKREKDVNKPKRDYILSDLNKKISQIVKNKTEAVVVLGDFNENPDEKNMKDFLYDNDFNKILINPSINLYKMNNFSTFHYKNGLLFDQMILSPNILEKNYPLTLKEAKIFNHQKLKSWDKGDSDRPFRTYAGSRYLGGFSDHFPIISVFEVK